MPTIPQSVIDSFVSSYVECALWSSTDNADDRGGAPLDRNYTAADLAPEAKARMQADCAAFLAANWASLEALDPGQAGHDFWLTRNGHGTGYWDRDLGAVGDTLTAASKASGPCDPYVGDDGQIYVA